MLLRVMCFVAGCTLTFTLFAVSTASAEDWPTFRGPKRTAIAPDKGLLTQWPAAGPKLVWESAGAGRGYSSLAIAAGRIYTLGDAPSSAEDKDEYLFCFDQTDGKPLWKTKTGPPWKSGREDWQSSRSTPTVDGDRVYALGAMGHLWCLKVDSGEVVWKKHLPTDFGTLDNLALKVCALDEF